MNLTCQLNVAWKILLPEGGKKAGCNEQIRETASTNTFFFFLAFITL